MIEFLLFLVLVSFIGIICFKIGYQNGYLDCELDHDAEELAEEDLKVFMLPKPKNWIIWKN